MSDDILGKLAVMIRSRKVGSGESSYTRQLLDAGTGTCAKKLGEEAIEVVIAGVGQNDEALRSEAADLLYHLLVLLESRGVDFEDVLSVLEARMGTSGLVEKAKRARQ